jgi:DNA polymerase IV
MLWRGPSAEIEEERRLLYVAMTRAKDDLHLIVPSYEARVFGVHSAMPSITANRNCPELIFVPPRFDVYKAVSLWIREIYAQYTPITSRSRLMKPIST